MSRKFAYLLASAAFLGGFLVAEFGAPDVFAQESEAPKWSHGMTLKARKATEDNFTPETKKWGLEVFEDANNSNLIYISETGSIAVVKK